MYRKNYSYSSKYRENFFPTVGNSGVISVRQQVSLFLFSLTGVHENMKLFERFLHGNSLGNAGVDCRRVLENVRGAEGCTAY
jgi:hypothetical protein